MKIVALLSGGKDSLFNLYLATREGHQVVAIANLMPEDEQQDELDSYMYQTVGHQAIETIAEALEKPLFRAKIKPGTTINKDLDYKVPEKGDEVEVLFNLLKSMRDEHGIDFDAVSVGAIASTYQKTRVENICQRLNLKMLAYLWGGDQHELLQQMIDNNFDAILIKVACLGLKQCHLGKSIKEMQDFLTKQNSQFQTNVCGEGGEYETLVLDCPLYKKKIVIDSSKIFGHQESDFGGVYHLRPTALRLVAKWLANINVSWQAQQHKSIKSHLLQNQPPDNDQTRWCLS